MDEILLAVKRYADEHPEQEWIVGASYDGSLAPEGLFDARWLDSWSRIVRWSCAPGTITRSGNTAAIECAGITRTPLTRCSVKYRTAQMDPCWAPCANGVRSTW